MKKLIVILILLSLILIGCITSKLKITDIKTGNSVVVTEQGIGVDIKQLEKDGYKVEVIE